MGQWLKSIRSGQTLAEVLLTMGLAALLLPALLTGWVASREGKAQQQQRTQATALLVEAVEAARTVRENGWTGFAVNGVWHPVVSGSTWTLVAGEQILPPDNTFTRSITISDVYRNASGELVTVGGTLDPSTKKVDVEVKWNSPLASSVTISAYFTRYLDNLAFVQTTRADFETGTLSGVTVTDTAGGEVILSSGGSASWCAPSLTIAAVDLPKSGVANALTAIESRGFAGTGNNASGVSYAAIHITAIPTASVSGTLDGFKTNDVFGELDYAYLATDNNAKEIAIIDLGVLPLAEIGSFDSSGPTDATAVFVSGSIGYMAAGNTLRTFDLSSKSGSRPQLGSVTLAGTGTEIVVNGGYAFVSIDGSLELQIINVANPASPTIVGQADTDSAGAQDVYINDTATRAYLATSASASKPEMFIIDVSTKNGNQPVVGSYESNGTSARGITAVTGNKVVFVGQGGEEYQVVDATDESHPVHCGGQQIDTGVNGVASVLEEDGDAYSYIITGDANAELRIIEGGPGGQFASSGTFESSTFDAGYSTAFNRVTPTSTLPTQTGISFHLAVADPVGGSCDGANYIYVGPDGTANTFFTSPGAIPLSDDGTGYENPGQCLRYRAYLTTASAGASPVFEQININYSP
ncbi:MAG: hypothetical protein Q7S31_02555 [bacterium]|nr:hypothetical protein [bacterium]